MNNKLFVAGAAALMMTTGAIAQTSGSMGTSSPSNSGAGSVAAGTAQPKMKHSTKTKAPMKAKKTKKTSSSMM